MPNSYRYKTGHTGPVSLPFKAGVAAYIGDCVYQDAADGHTAKPGGSFTWDTDLATTQTAFALVFVGVAMQGYDGSNANAYGIKDGYLRVASRGIFEFDCASANFKVGDRVGLAKQSGNLLEPQKVVAVDSDAKAIGRVVEDKTSATKIKVEIFPKRTMILA